MKPPVPLEDLVAHRPPALLLREIVEVEAGRRIVCRARVDSESHFGGGGESTSAWLAVEIGAQAAGVLEACTERGGSAGATVPSTGYLVTVRDLAVPGGALPVGMPLTVEARAAGGAGPLRFYEVTVSLEQGRELARGTVGVYAGPDS